MIIEAAKTGNIDLVKTLVAAGVPLHLYDNEALRYAAMNGYTEIVRLLLEQSSVSPQALNNDSLNQAAKNGHADVVALLLESVKPLNSQGCRNFADLSSNRCEDYSPYVYAILNDHKTVVSLLLQNENYQPTAELTILLLRIAIQFKKLDILELLLLNSIVNSLDFESRVLPFAVKQEDKDTLNCVLRNASVLNGSINSLEFINFNCKSNLLNMILECTRLNNVDNKQLIHRIVKEANIDFVLGIIEDEVLNGAGWDSKYLTSAAVNLDKNVFLTLFRQYPAPVDISARCYLLHLLNDRQCAEAFTTLLDSLCEVVQFSVSDSCLFYSNAVNHENPQILSRILSDDRIQLFGVAMPNYGIEHTLSYLELLKVNIVKSAHKKGLAEVLNKIAGMQEVSAAIKMLLLPYAIINHQPDTIRMLGYLTEQVSLELYPNSAILKFRIDNDFKFYRFSSITNRTFRAPIDLKVNLTLSNLLSKGFTRLQMLLNHYVDMAYLFQKRVSRIEYHLSQNSSEKDRLLLSPVENCLGSELVLARAVVIPLQENATWIARYIAIRLSTLATLYFKKYLSLHFENCVDELLHRYILKFLNPSLVCQSGMDLVARELGELGHQESIWPYTSLENQSSTSVIDALDLGIEPIANEALQPNLLFPLRRRHLIIGDDVQLGRRAQRRPLNFNG